MSALNGKGVRVELTGGAMQLRFDMNSLIDIEDTYGSLEGFETALTVKPFRALRFVVWTAGTWLGDTEQAPRSETEVGARIDPKQLKGLSDAVAAALVEAVGLEEDQAAPEGPTGAAAATPSPS